MLAYLILLNNQHKTCVPACRLMSFIHYELDDGQTGSIESALTNWNADCREATIVIFNAMD